MIRKIEWARLEAIRPRVAGCNARLGVHGQQLRPPIARITDQDGRTGFGWSRVEQADAERLVGSHILEVIDSREGVSEACRGIEFPLWDLYAQRLGQPVHRLLGSEGTVGVPCYDTSLYFDDLHLDDDQAAADLLAGEATDGLARGHNAFKIKVGRGAMHLPVEAGTRRDIAIILAVREAVGPDATLLLDANNGYNYNLTRQVLSATAGARIHWLEEAFHEDPHLLRLLKEWMAAEGLQVLIADGEGDASPRLLDYARDGLVDVVQYDFLHRGLTFWLALARQLDAYGTASAPHHYGGWYGNYVTGHFAPAAKHFAFVEWDEADCPAIDTSAYAIVDGQVVLPSTPGFGLLLDEAAFAHAVAEHGWTVEA